MFYHKAAEFAYHMIGLGQENKRETAVMNTHQKHADFTTLGKLCSHEFLMSVTRSCHLYN